MKKTIDQLDSLHHQLLDIVSSIEENRFSRRPTEAEWSIAEVMHHLFLAEGWMLKELEKGLKRPPERLGALRNIFKPPVWITGLRLIRVKAPKRAEPLNPPPKATTIENYNDVRVKMKEMATTEGRARLEQIVAVHPILGKYNGAHLVSFAHYHELRHYKQIKEIIRKISN